MAKPLVVTRCAAILTLCSDPGGIADGGHDMTTARMAEVRSIIRSDAPVDGLAARLLSDTAGLRLTFSRVVDLPSAVRSRSDYLDLLGAFNNAHHLLEPMLSPREWTGQWARLGVDPVLHRRAPLLDADLTDLGVRMVLGDAPLPRVTTFADALGALFVLDGPTLDGPALARTFRTRWPGLPVRYLSGTDRPIRRTWGIVRAALDRFGEQGGLGDDVLNGAVRTYDYLALVLRSRGRDGAIPLQPAAEVG